MKLTQRKAKMRQRQREMSKLNDIFDLESPELLRGIFVIFNQKIPD